VNEGDPVTIPFTFTDPAGGVHTATVRWADGTPAESVALDTDGTTGSGVASHVYGDDGSFGVVIEICGDVDCGSTSVTASTLNVPPEVQPPTGTPTDATLDIEAAFTDPGTSDTHTATVNWGDGTSATATVTAGPGGGTVTSSHSYSTSGTFTVEVCVTDDDTGVGCASAPHTVTVPNTAPSLQVDSPTSLEEGSQFQLAGSFDDPDADSWTLTVDWGDGTDSETIPLAAAGAFTVPHTYLDDGTFTVTVTVSDGVDDDSVALFGIEVTNVAPSLDASFSVENLDVDLLAGVSDPGADQLTATVDWGDGTVEDATSPAGAPSKTDGAASSAQFVASHTYSRSGAWDTEVCATDDDGARTCVQERVTVNSTTSPPPSTTTPGATGDTGDTGDSTPMDSTAPTSVNTVDPVPPGTTVSDSSITSGQLAITGSNLQFTLRNALTLILAGLACVLAVGWRRRNDRNRGVGTARQQ
jgi:hypothetical protein